MNASLLDYWDRIRGSFWFVPGLMVAGALLLALGTVALDQSLGDGPEDLPEWVYGGGAEGASAVLATIAGSMATIAGVVFSLTLVTLSLTAQQFGSRLLRNFMRDLPTQVVLGTFTATFLYCLLVLRSVRRVDEGVFVPHLSVTLAVLFALASLAMLIYFIHHVAMSIQADEVVERVAAELRRTIDRLFPEPFGHGAQDDVAVRDALPPGFDRQAVPVCAAADGYVQRVDGEVLLREATGRDLVVAVDARPGAYVVAGMVLLRAWPAPRLDDAAAKKLAAAFVIGEQRTPAQDLEFSVGQLVGIAGRALTPDTNDGASATTCIDRLGSALCRLAGRRMPAPLRYDDAGRLRLVARGSTFPEVLDLAYDPLRQYARACALPGAFVRLLQSLAVIARSAHRADDRAALRRQADLVVESAYGVLASGDDLARVQRCHLATLDALAPAGATEAGELPPD
jgi:uncharacterized membrane protein